MTQKRVRIAMRLMVTIMLFMVSAHGANRPQEGKAINYALRGHPYFRMLYDWFSKDAATGREVRTMADADQAMLRRSGFNAVHLFLWDQPTRAPKTMFPVLRVSTFKSFRSLSSTLRRPITPPTATPYRIRTSINLVRDSRPARLAPQRTNAEAR